MSYQAGVDKGRADAQAGRERESIADPKTDYAHGYDLGWMRGKQTRMSEAPALVAEATALMDDIAGRQPGTGGKTTYTERVRTDELAPGDVIEHSDGSRQTVINVRGRLDHVTTDRRRVLLRDAAGHEVVRHWHARSSWDRLTEDAKREAGYLTAEHDVPSVREERELPCVDQDGECSDAGRCLCYERSVREPRGASARVLRLNTIAEMVQEMADQDGAPLQEHLDRMAAALVNLGAPALTDNERHAVTLLLQG